MQTVRKQISDKYFIFPSFVFFVFRFYNVFSLSKVNISAFTINWEEMEFSCIFILKTFHLEHRNMYREARACVFIFYHCNWQMSKKIDQYRRPISKYKPLLNIGDESSCGNVSTFARSRAHWPGQSGCRDECAYISAVLRNTREKGWRGRWLERSGHNAELRIGKEHKIVASRMVGNA